MQDLEKQQTFHWLCMVVEDYAVAIENGICKVNYYTYMNTAGGKASKEYWQDDSKPLFYDSMSLVATEAIKEDVKRAIKVFQKIK